jgi:DNA-binding NarL/FixJ family response regulator
MNEMYNTQRAAVENLLHQLIDLLHNETVWVRTHETPDWESAFYQSNINGELYTIQIHRCPRTEASPVLSHREQEIVRLISKGLPNKTIALKLAISPYTVSTYLRRIFLKLNVRSRSEMVAKILTNDYSS